MQTQEHIWSGQICTFAHVRNTYVNADEVESVVKHAMETSEFVERKWITANMLNFDFSATEMNGCQCQYPQDVD